MSKFSIHDLATLIQSHYSLISIDTAEERRLEAQLAEICKSLNLKFFYWSLTGGLRHLQMPVAGDTKSPEQVMEYLLEHGSRSIYLLKDFDRYLEDDLKMLRYLKENVQRLSGHEGTIVLSGHGINLPTELSQVAIPVMFELPSLQEIFQMAKPLVESAIQSKKVRFEMSQTDWTDLLEALQGLTMNQARQVLLYCMLHDGRLSSSDITHARKLKARHIKDNGLLEYMPIEDNAFEIGGFEELKKWVNKAKSGFSSKAKEINLESPKGVLLTGVQGCGKSLAAKTIAKEFGLPFLKLEAARLYDKYVGETEKNFLRATSLAASLAPCVLWIDEIEKVFSPGSSTGSEGNLSTRILGILLNWLQEKNEQVFVVATANDIFALPPELQRKGRFDEVFFVDLPDKIARKEIFRIHLNLRKQDTSRFNFNTLTSESEGFTGAEIEQVVVSSLFNSLHTDTVLETKDLLAGIKQTIPLSISRREDIDKLREIAGERFVSAA